MDFSHSYVWIPNGMDFRILQKSLVFRHIFGQNVYETQTFCSDFRHYCKISEIKTLLFGFHTKSLDFRQVQILHIWISDIYCSKHC